MQNYWQTSLQGNLYAPYLMTVKAVKETLIYRFLLDFIECSHSLLILPLYKKKKKAFSTFTQVSYKKMQYLILANIYA